MSDATKTAENKPTFKPELAELGGSLEGKLTIDGDTGIAVLDADAFKDHLPEGQTIDSLIAAQKTIDLFGNGLKLALVRAGVKTFQANKKLEQISLNAPTFGSNAFEAVLRRNGESRAPGSTEVKAVKGVITVFKHEVVGTRPKAESTAIKNEFRNLAEAAGL